MYLKAIRFDEILAGKVFWLKLYNVPWICQIFIDFWLRQRMALGLSELASLNDAVLFQ